MRYLHLFDFIAFSASAYDLNFNSVNSGNVLFTLVGVIEIAHEFKNKSVTTNIIKN
jgi:hypothetical protein